MVSIILLWNVHPNESPATLPMARKLKQALERKGHEVEIRKVPFSATLQGQVKKMRSGLKLVGPSDLRIILNLATTNKDHLIFDIHTTPIEVYQYFGIFSEKPEKWRSVYTPYSSRQARSTLEINKTWEYGENVYTIEFPAIYKPSHRNLRKIFKGPPHDPAKPYFFGQADPVATQKAGVFSETTIRRLTGTIEKIIGQHKELHRKTMPLEKRRIRTMKRDAKEEKLGRKQQRRK